MSEEHLRRAKGFESEVGGRKSEVGSWKSEVRERLKEDEARRGREA